MTLDVYARGLARRWFLVLALLGVGIFSGYMYFSYFGKEIAVVRVAAIESALLRAAQNNQAQFTFGSVLESHALAQRVIDRLSLTDITARDLSQEISARPASSAVPNVITPLYNVEVRDRDPERALLIANTLVDEAKTLFVELNQPDREAFIQAYQAQLEPLREEVRQRRIEYDAFRQQNQIYSPGEQISRQATIITQLLNEQRLQAIQTEVLSITNQINALTLEDLNKQRARTESEIRALGSRLFGYNELQFELNLAEQVLAQIGGAETQISIAGSLGADIPNLSGIENAQGQALERVREAREALLQYQQKNDIAGIDTRIGVRGSAMTILDQARIQAAGTNRIGAATFEIQQSLAADLAARLQAERLEMQRLMKLLPEFERLQTALATREGVLARLEGELDLQVFQQTTVNQVQVRVLDPPTIQPQTIFTIAVYAAAALLGLIIGMLLVYLLVYFDKTLYSASEAERLLGMPVLTTIARG